MKTSPPALAGLLASILATGILGASCAHPSVAPPTPPPPAAPMVSGYAPVNGLKMFYEIHGDAAGVPLVLVHGGGSTIDSNWSMMIPLLVRHRRLIAIEEQGHGHTAAIDRPFTFDHTADDVAALLDHLGIARADVLGFSNGGSTALRLGLRHPGKVRRLIVASAMYRRDGMPNGFWEMMKHAKLEMMPKSLQDADRRINPDPKHLDALFKQDSARMAAFKDWPDADIRGVRAPTLVLIGDHDVILPEHAIRMSRLLPHGRLTILRGDHGSFFGEVSAQEAPGQIPQATATVIEDFLSSKD